MSEPTVGAESVAVVVVTYNRGALLMRMLGGLAALERQPDAVIVVDNASTDHTQTVLDGARDAHPHLPLEVIRTEQNLGGAGGFHLGMRTAYEQSYDRIWLMDDDVVPAPDCLGVLMAVDEDCVIIQRSLFCADSPCASGFSGCADSCMARWISATASFTSNGLAR